MSSIGSTPPPSPTDPPMPSYGTLTSQLMDLAVHDMMLQVYQMQVKLAEARTMAEADKVRRQSELMRQHLGAVLERLRSVSATIKAQEEAAAAATAAMAAGAMGPTFAMEKPIGGITATQAAGQETTDTAVTQTKQQQALAEISRTMLQEQQEMAAIQAKQRAAVEQMAQVLRQQVERQRQLFRAMGS
jgi:hypothetical protein